VHRALALRDPLLPVAAHYAPGMEGNFAGWTPLRSADCMQFAALQGRPAIEKSQDISGIHGGSEQYVIAQTTIEIVRQTISDDRFTAKAACYGKAT
jgi:hypothetical protein